MDRFTLRERNLIYLHNPGNRIVLIIGLEEMLTYLMPDEVPLRLLVESVIRKLEQITDYEYPWIADRIQFVPKEDNRAG